MPALDILNDGPPVVTRLLVHTTIPAQALPMDLCLPTFAMVSLKSNSLLIQVKKRDPENDFWGTDDPSVPTAEFVLSKRDILHVFLGGTWQRRYSRYPTAAISVRDPLGVADSFELTFTSTDANNPNYWIKALAMILRDHLGVQVQESVSEVTENDDLPF